MLKKTVLWLTLGLIMVMGGEALALPKSMIMTSEISSSEGGRNMTANATVYYMDMKFRTEVASNSNMNPNNSAVKVTNKATVIMDMKKKVGYLLDERSKSAIKIDIDEVNRMTGSNSSNSPTNFSDPSLLSDPAKLRAELKKQGAKEVGKEKLLGYQCTVWQIDSTSKAPARGNAAATTEKMQVKVWLADDISVPLKATVNSDKRGQIASMTTKNLQVNVPMKATIFNVPSGYKVTTMQEMMNKAQK